MEKVLMSFKPERVAKILNREATIEVMETAPKSDLPVEVNIYCENGAGLQKFGDRYFTQEGQFPVRNGKIVGKFILKKAEQIRPKVKLGLLQTFSTYETDTLEINPLLDKSGLVYDELDSRLKGKVGYAWHIFDLEIFDEPKEIDDFIDEALENYRYLEENE